MEQKARECPHCHRKISIKNCSTYLLRGTATTIHCDHCNTELALIKEPIPFKWCPLIGFLSTFIPAEYFLFIKNLSFAKSMSYAAMIGVVAIIIIGVLTFRRSYFKIV